MGGEFGDEDERKITRLENSSTSAVAFPNSAAAAASNKLTTNSGATGHTQTPPSPLQATPPNGPLAAATGGNLSNGSRASKFINGPPSPANLASQLPNLNSTKSDSSTQSTQSQQLQQSNRNSSPLANGNLFANRSPIPTQANGPLPPGVRSDFLSSASTVKTEATSTVKSEPGQLPSLSNSSIAPNLDTPGALRFPPGLPPSGPVNGPGGMCSSLPEMGNNLAPKDMNTMVGGSFNNNLVPPDSSSNVIVKQEQLKPQQTPSPQMPPINNSGSLIPSQAAPPPPPPQPISQPSPINANFSQPNSHMSVPAPNVFMPNPLAPPHPSSMHDFNSFNDMKVSSRVSISTTRVELS